MNPEKSNFFISTSSRAKRSVSDRRASERSTESSCSSFESLASSISSPVSNLTINLQVLSTHGPDMKIARRKLSLTSSCSETSETDSPFPHQRQTSLDDGCCLDSPVTDSNESVSYDSPFLQNWTAPADRQNFYRTNFKRFHSAPVNTFSGSSGVTVASKVASVREADRSCSAIKLSELRGDENKENEGAAVESCSKHGDFMKSVGFKLPLSPAPHSVIYALADETNISTSFRRHASAQKASIRQSKQDSLYKSPEASYRLCSSYKLPKDDGFRDKQQSTVESPNQLMIPKDLQGLLFSPVAEASEFESSPTICHEANKLSASDESLGNENVPSIVRGLFRSPSAPKLIRRKFSAHETRISYKRSESQTQDSDLTPLQMKRWKGLTKEKDKTRIGQDRTEEDSATTTTTRRRIMRCHSETEIFIKSALSWADSQQNLIGDFTKPFCLPLINSKHQDLKAISPETMAAIISNHYSDLVENCIVIDCRYPYEFHGGHILGARNVFTTEDLMGVFFAKREPCSPTSVATCSPGTGADKRTVLIFHCEFSSERGPKLSRFLRNADRDANIDSYPALHYPEIYLLEGGYKAFYESYPLLCQPQGYVPMLHQNHMADLKMYRSKASSWAMDRARIVGRGTLGARSFLNL